MPNILLDFCVDCRHTLRLWLRRPWHTAFAVFALAIGIGANTGVFSVVNALLLRSLPFRDPQSLVAMRQFFPPHDSAAQFHDWRAHSQYLADAALTEQTDVNLGGAGEWRRAHVAQASWNFFGLLGVQAILGRTFAEGEDVTGRNTVAVIGYGLWQQLYAGDPRALGAVIRVDGNPLTIIGVAPPGFDYPGKSVLWKPATFVRGNNGWDAIGRLKPGETLAQVRRAFAIEADRVWPGRARSDQSANPPTMVSLRDELAGPARGGSLALMASVALILLIACVNVANLSMARTADRLKELSIRSALGAARARLLRQLLTESVLLSLVASLAGIGVALWTVALAEKLQPAALASQAYSILDTRVLSFTLAASILAGLLFGALPSLYAGRAPTLGAREVSARGSRLIRDALVAAQVMLTILLLAASLSVGRAFLHLMHIDRGYDWTSLVTINVSLDGTTYQKSGRVAYFEEALARVRRIPGVRSASATEFLPIASYGAIGSRFSLDGRVADRYSMIVPVLSDYFRTMGGDVLYGREFTDAEIRSNARVAVVDERFAAQFGPPATAIGHEIWEIWDNGNHPRKIIGVVRGMSYSADGAPGENQIFIPSDSPGSFYSAFVARVDGPPGERLAAIRDAIQSVDSQVPVFGVKTMEQRVTDALARPRFYRTAVACFGAFALLLAVIGIYGVVAYAVAQRAHEMAVRMALGTTPSRLRAVLLCQGLATVAAGAVPGILAAMLSGRVLENLIDGAQSPSAGAYAACVAFISAVAALGIWIASRPVARLEIMEVLRSE